MIIGLNLCGKLKHLVRNKFYFMKTFLFVANRGFALTSSRLGIFKSLKRSGHNVVVCVGLDAHVEKLQELGITVEEISVDRGGLSALRDVHLFIRLAKLYRKWKPAVIHNFHAKPIVFGALASLVVPRAKVVNNFEGLGFPFVSKGVMYRLSLIAFKIALYRSSQNVFLNYDDLDLFLSKGIVSSSKATLVFSPGVDVEKFRPSKEKELASINVVMAGRLLWSKGIKEFCFAAKEIKKDHPEVRFLIAGEWDLHHSDSIDKKSLQSLVDKCGVEFLGYVNDMPALLNETYCFVLPTKYREGVPRVVLEAQSSGVPVITTNVPGCRHAVIDGQTGYIVEPGDHKSLSQSIDRLIISRELRKEFSENAIARATSQFDTKIVTEKQLDVYRELGFSIIS